MFHSEMIPRFTKKQSREDIACLCRNSSKYTDWRAHLLLSFHITVFKELDDLPPLSPLQPISEEEAVQIVADPPLPPASFTLRDYVDHSENLQKLVLLGKSE